MRSPLRFALSIYLFLFTIISVEAASNISAKNVFVLLPGQPGTPFTVDYLQGMRKTFNNFQ
jgi:hypothetical protein